MAGDFIRGAIKKPGQLHRDLGVPQGQKIPAAALKAAAGRGGKVGERARFAQTLEGLRPKKKPVRRDSSMLARAAAGKNGY